MVLLSADHHFTIGTEHVSGGKPCQDHALSLAEDNMACAVVSDGCSGAGETDMGARVLTFACIAAAKAYYKRHHNDGDAQETLVNGIVSEVGTQQRIVLGTAREALGLARDDMLATCGYIFFTQGGGVAHLEGDGVIAVKYRDGCIMISRYDWGKAPFYPQYREEHGGAGYVREHGGADKIGLVEERWLYTPSSDENLCQLDTIEWTVADGMRGITCSYPKGQMDNIDTVAVFTDGALRIDNVDWRTAVVELLQFPSTMGSFVKRQLNGVLKKFRKTGKGPMDDIAYAVVHITTVPTEGEPDGTTNQNT